MSERNEIEDSAGELRDQLVMWRRFEELSEWAAMRKYVEQLIHHRTNAVMHTQLTSLEAALSQEFQKGECNMAEFLVSIPKLQIERIELELVEVNRTLEENPDASGSTSSGNTSPDSERDPIDPERDAFTE